MPRLGAVAGWALSSFLVVGCAAPTMYRWENYDQTLYDHYKHPQERDAFVANLKAIVDGAEKARSKVPPGCYAEYGYALYEESRFTDARQYFEKERDTWPESKGLMERMIANAARLAERPTGPSKTPAAATSSPATLGKGGAR
jgi:hypothetical protein